MLVRAAENPALHVLGLHCPGFRINVKEHQNTPAATGLFTPWNINRHKISEQDSYFLPIWKDGKRQDLTP